uniref:Uncharacterized protein n=1 Tax=Lotharella globosa TaxID=91324 RepID=A0A7S3YQK6_9EUKA
MHTGDNLIHYEGWVPLSHVCYLQYPQGDSVFVGQNLYCITVPCWPKTRFHGAADIRFSVYLNILLDSVTISQILLSDKGSKIYKIGSALVGVVDLFISVWGFRTLLLRLPPNIWLVLSWMAAAALWFGLALYELITWATGDAAIDRKLFVLFAIQAVMTLWDASSANQWRNEVVAGAAIRRSSHDHHDDESQGLKVVDRSQVIGATVSGVLLALFLIAAFS